MKTSLLTLLSTALLGSAALAQSVILEDQFDSYSAGALVNNSAWPSAIPGGSLSWTTNNGGPQSIAAAPGRSGNAYHYQEVASGQTTTFSSVTLAAPSGATQWELSLDFYLDRLVTPSWFAITALGNGALTTSANTLFNLAVSRHSTTNNIGFAVGGATFFADDSNRLAELGQWYTLTVTGDSEIGTAGELNLTLTGNNYAVSRTYNFSNGHTDFTTLSIGDTTPNAWVAGRSNSVFIDNYRLQAIPEPASLLWIAAGLSLFSVAGLRRRCS